MTRLLFLTALCAGFTFSACKKDKKTTEELITRVTVHLTGANLNFDQEFEAKDTDGDGVFDSIDEIALPTLGIYNCHLHVYDDTKSPVEDITEEIEAENTAHLFRYTVTGALLSVSSLNTDDNGAPFGLESVWTSTTASSGLVKIVLYHEPTDKNNPSDPGGDVDVEVSFPVKIQ